MRGMRVVLAVSVLAGVVAPSAEAAITVSPSHVDFPPTPGFTRSQPKTFTITANSQDANVYVQEDKTTDPFPRSFGVVDDGPGFLLRAGTSKSIRVFFAPTREGQLQATVDVTDANSGPVPQPVPVTLSGFGLPRSAGGGTGSPKCHGKTATIVATKGMTTKGTSKADVIVGTSKSDKINGGGGNDLICAGGGNDKLSGGSGSDKIYGGSGNDSISGGSGKDKLYGEAGKDKLKGGPGKDKLSGGPGKDKTKQ